MRPTVGNQHELKCWPIHFADMVNGYKTFELRVNDRNFQVADILYLREFNPATQQYTGRNAMFVVTYALPTREWTGTEHIVMAVSLVGVPNMGLVPARSAT